MVSCQRLLAWSAAAAWYKLTFIQAGLSSAHASRKNAANFNGLSAFCGKSCRAAKLVQPVLAGDHLSQVQRSGWPAVLLCGHLSRLTAGRYLNGHNARATVALVTSLNP